MDEKNLIYIENDGALFRGPSRGNPLEVWSEREGKFKPYKGAGKPRDISWGNEISEEEARALMGDRSAGSDKPE